MLMLRSLLKLNLVLAWLWILLGFLSGMVLGLNFQREDWLGGYAGYQRRLYRLGHISFFGLAIMNLLFVFSVQQTVNNQACLTATIRLASLAFAVGAVTMPLCCVVAAHKKEARALFAVPV